MENCTCVLFTQNRVPCNVSKLRSIIIGIDIDVIRYCITRRH